MGTFITQDLAHKFLRSVYNDLKKHDDVEEDSYEEWIDFVLESADLFFPEVVYAAFVTKRTHNMDLITEATL
jgi:hypothetical protein